MIEESNLRENDNAAAVDEPEQVSSSFGVPMSSGSDPNANEDERRRGDPLPVAIKSVSFLRQLRCVLRKNALLIWRRPIMLLFMTFSSVIAVLLAWPAGRDSDQPFPPLTDCGTVPEEYLAGIEDYDERQEVPVSLNEGWRDGLPVAILSLGPMVQAIAAFLIVHNELQNKLFGVLRGLGLRDSVYWISWYLVFFASSLVNSILGAIAAQFVPVHAFETVYFGGVFASFLFLQLALVPTSLFLAAVCGTARRAAVWLVLVMLVAVWIPLIVIDATSGYTSISPYDYRYVTTPTALFWLNANTQSNNEYNYINNTYTSCNVPIMAEEQGKFYKTEAERAQVQDDEFFLGCYVAAGFGSQQWNPTNSKGKIGTASLFCFPYFHFNTMWGNFLGYTGMPDRKFTSKESTLSPEKLAIASLPNPPNPDNGFNGQGTMAPQGSTFKVSSDYGNDCFYDPNSGSYICLSNCPLPNRTDADFCSYSLYNCYYAPEPVPTDSPSVRQMMGYLFALSIIYTLLASYWAQVFPMGNGAARKFYFFIIPSYWFGARSSATGKKKKSGESSGSSNNIYLEETVEASAEQYATPESSSGGGGVGVIVNNVRKVYGNTAAVKDVSLQMARGEVTALLGHNGAGKTTLSHVLCCEIAPSNGDVSVFGHSVTADQYAVRRLVGVCKQDDYLWPNLTAKEHLELYAGLRGVRPAEEDMVVQKWLESVDLADVQLQYSSSFSGGMKRRLSVALATIGDRPLIVLDEPTTGMDPVSRRFVWRHIDEIKVGRVVLLTTHAMEEADLLADMVAIMRKGELAAFGSPLQLKSEYGSALQFSVLVDRSYVTASETTIREHFADAMEWVTIDAGEAGNITVTIQRVRQNEDEGGVDVHVLSNFVAWLESDESRVSEYGFSNSSLEEVFLKVTKGEREAPETPPPAVENANGDEPPLVEENGREEGEYEAGSMEIATFKPNLTVRSQVGALLWHSFTRNWTGMGSIWNYVIFGLFVVVTIIMGLIAGGFYDWVSIVAVPCACLSLMLLSVVAPIYSDRAEGLFYLMRTQGLLARSYLLGTGLYAFSIQLVYGLVLLSLFFATPLFRDPIICNEENEWGYGWCEHKFGDPPIINNPPTIDFFDGGEFEGEDVRLMAVPSAGGYGRIIGTAFLFAFTFPGAVLASSYLPGNKVAVVLVACIVLLASIYPFIQSVLPLDEDEGVECLNTIDPKNLCQETFTIENCTEAFLNCVGLAINDAPKLCVPPYAALLPQFGLFQTLSMTLLARIKFVSEPEGYAEQVLIPSMRGVKCSGDTCVFPYARKLYGQNLGYQCLGAVILVILGVCISLVIAFPSGVVLHLKYRLSRALSDLKSLTCNNRGKQQWQEKGPVHAAELEEVSEERSIVHELVKPLLAHPERVDVERGIDDDTEPVLTNHGAIPREELPPVLMYKLRKVYPSLGGVPPKVALKSFDLRVPQGQVLGLLGKNGAGKTTVLKILSAAHDSSGGLAFVDGYDVSCERIRIFECLGNCQQFDVIWPKQTVQQHLEFFARLKGLPHSQVGIAARSIAAAVGLGAPEVFRRHAAGLSGGMRRRLSIAISLIGAPSVLLLDEPTTGLDPSTRNSIWGLVNSFATEDRAIIITTHMMIEADTLCSRIAIVSRGQLKVVGTQQHLKDQYGSGYMLQLNLVHSTLQDQENAMAFVRQQLHNGAVLGVKQAKTLHIMLPKDLDLQKTFAALYSPESRSQGGINQFLLSQSSLEDVFIALGD